MKEKKAEVEKSISFDDNHAIEEVCQYVQEQWGFKEADRNSAEYKFMYKQIKHDMNSEINLFLYVREDNGAHMDIEIELPLVILQAALPERSPQLRNLTKFCVMYSYIMVSCRTT